jgi:hypothetical protein
MNTSHGSKQFLIRFVLPAVLLTLVGGVSYFVSLGIGPSSVTAEPAAIPGEATDTALGREIENLAFGVGEKLEFDINYGFINAGTASMEVEKLIEYETRPCYQIVTHANSNKFFTSFYKVDDRVESVIDALGLFSWRFEKHLREGGYKADRTSVFDQPNNRVIDGKDTIPVEPYTQDALSVLYFIRTVKLEVGKSVYAFNYVDGQKVNLEIKVLKKEKITVAAGTFDCLVVEPLTSSVGVFKNEGTLKVWLTDDRLRLPVLMKSKILVGSISAELTDYQLGEIAEF